MKEWIIKDCVREDNRGKKKIKCPMHPNYCIVPSIYRENRRCLRYIDCGMEVPKELYDLILFNNETVKL